ncbi:predicted protein [Histoplasma mississippiense (nom. inval.)]|uniref:predicted protein n=1 Tax=Ajellomyces capsulatus (strain NAm1 / WU24) TaxID=2059318 RepID=UPI000157B6F2|nr:predicted protein [Histoplasma mississippiense (nom. inval.)]EDN03647.1 predicted protein [Histoplasma mississippiense (nom. inval.)]
MEPIKKAEWELQNGIRRLNLRQLPGPQPIWKWKKETGKLSRGKSNGIDWYRYQVKILLPKLFPFANECEKERPNTIVQEDRAPAHDHYIQHHIYEIHHIQRMLWCANSPDLNTIEPAWTWMKRKTTVKGAPQNRAAAIAIWERTWRDLPQEQIQAWIERIPVHIKKVIEIFSINFMLSRARQNFLQEHLYKLMRCPGPPSHLGQYCWQDPNGKKHYKLGPHHLKKLIRYVDNEGILETHSDVPDAIREQLHKEEQQRLEKGQSRGSNTLAPNNPYPININLLPTQSPQTSMSTTQTPAISADMNTPYRECPNILGPRDDAVKEYSKWQELNVTSDTYKAEIRKACSIALENCLDLEQIFDDQNPNFFVENGVKIGIARRFVNDIAAWAEQQEELLQNSANLSTTLACCSSFI